MKHAAGALLSSIRLDRTLRRSVSVQLYMALRDMILSGALRAGERLPATRTLAKEVGVSRTTVIDAIDRLVAEGMLVSRIGAGTYVSETLENQHLTTPPSEGAGGRQPRLSYVISHAEPAYARRAWLPHKPRAFVTALPALDAFPMAHWARLSARHLRGGRGDVMGYGQPKGLAALRRAIATHLSALKGIRCHPEQVFITSGAQHAFSLIGRLLLNPGDRVWMENPGASGARNALLSEGAELVPVDVDGQGMVVSDGLAKAPHFRLAFVTPSHQQPLGHVMSLPRRLELLQAAEQAQALIIEDDYDGEFYFGNAPRPALHSIDANGRVLYVGTFSKSLFPSLRLGFVLVPERMVAAFDGMFNTWASGPSTATQAIVAEFMDEGHFATHIRLMRQLYKARYEALLEAARGLPESIGLQETTSGFHTPAFLAPGVDEAEVVAQAAQQGVTLAPLARYCLSPIPQTGLVFGFGCATPEDIARGMGILRDLPVLR
ncbi:transcriptional regulator, GntR family (plasmid) [Ruegeria pomeroyi DSS-3]|uniref:Transcriptional regulator, GntR family n=2 Tax=Ruegeria pomeroyi TaxID=89184 RepID=Q5LKK2_RUEPO|nr:PLP-dependent aminotransferase family protein [Ruegeria pomeroyi]AAV97511.1 transcriptional regulator, GntR family [Ruegeria pomeroyi DSS-3]NVK97845.1 PLP-dependent aminotransferase family protein [Ruegeria pomeroyi]NVL01371.1 PLP-dependent aminotransferase family protein [Ruegeria pomeroyi]HCE71037.1 PLP-dependent aminotransferase family protein [Ruegeria sp.]